MLGNKRVKLYLTKEKDYVLKLYDINSTVAGDLSLH